MMRLWLRYLPYALVVWLAKRNCERVDQFGLAAVVIFPGELFSWEFPKPN